MPRKIQSTQMQLAVLPSNGLPVDDVSLAHFMQAQAITHGLTHALGHCDDGVTYGVWRQPQSQWQWSCDAFPAISPSIKKQTLRELRLFGATTELMLWRTGNGFAARVCKEISIQTANAAIDYFDEDMMFWGTKDVAPQQAFTLMREGAQGFLHTPPSDLAKRGCLSIRTYIHYHPSSGCAQTLAQRLLAPSMSKEQV